MKFGAKLCFYLIFFILVISVATYQQFGLSYVLAQDNSTVVRPDPLKLEVGLGQEETLAIVLENAQEIYGIDVRASFDIQGVEIVDVDGAKDGIQMKPGDFIKPDFVVINNVDNLLGNLQYVTTQINPTPPANGNGIVLLIQVKGKKLGEYPFIIEFIDVADRRGNQLPIQAKNSVIQVVLPKPNTPTTRPTPTNTIVTTPSATTTGGSGLSIEGTTQATGVSKENQTQEPAGEHSAWLPVLSGDTVSSDQQMAAIQAEKIAQQSNTLKWISIGGIFGAGLLILLSLWVYFKRK